MPSGDNSPDNGDSATSTPNDVRRRALLGSIGAAGTTFLAGCGGDGGGGSPTDGGGDGSPGGGGGQSTEQPKYLITDVTDDPPSLDPHAIASTANNAKNVWPGNAYETLVFYESGESTLKPVLASEVPTTENGLITNDGKTFEFPLKEGITFHTGQEMTAQDVKFSIERIQTMGLAPGADTLQNQIESVEIPDDYTVRITTDQPRPAFLNGTVPSKAMTVVSQEAVENHGGVQEGARNRWMAQNTAGTGPYRLAEWNRGSSIRWDPHGEYHAPETVGPDGHFQYVHSSVSTSVASMGGGQMHGSGYELASLPEFDGTGAEFKFFESLAQLFLFFNYEIPYGRGNMPDSDTVPSSFFQDPAVRKAFGYAIPFDDYVETVWEGHGFPSNQPCHTRPLRFFDDSAPNFTHDPAKAEQFFKEAGYWEEGFTFTLMSENFAEAANTQLYLKDQLEELNDRFTINTMTMPAAQYVQRRNQEPWSFTCDAGGFPAFGPDPAPYYDALLEGPPATGTNMPEYIDDRIIEAADQAATTLDADRREELYAELQRLCVEDPPHISLLTEQQVQIHKSCAEPTVNPVTGKDVAKRWDISECERIDF